MAVGVLGGAEEGKIGTEIQRLLQQAGGKGVVHGDNAARLVCNFADGLGCPRFSAADWWVIQPHQRGLEPCDEIVVLRIGEVGVFDFDAETLQHLFEDAVGAAVDLLLGEDGVAGLEGKQDGGDGAEAAGEGGAVLRVLQAGERGLEVAEVRIA